MAEDMNKPHAIPRTSSALQPSSTNCIQTASLNKISPMCSHLSGAVPTPLVGVLPRNQQPCPPTSSSSSSCSSNNNVANSSTFNRNTSDSSSQCNSNYVQQATKFQMASNNHSSNSSVTDGMCSINEPSLMSQLAAELNFNFSGEAKNR